MSSTPLAVMSKTLTAWAAEPELESTDDEPVREPAKKRGRPRIYSDAERKQRRIEHNKKYWAKNASRLSRRLPDQQLVVLPIAGQSA